MAAFVSRTCAHEMRFEKATASPASGFAGNSQLLCSSCFLTASQRKRKRNAALDGGGHPLPRLQPDLEALRTLEDDVGLKPEIRLFDVRLDTKVSHNCGQNDLQLEHGIFATHAGTRSSGERYKSVVMPIGGFLRQEVVGVEDFRIRIDVRLPMHFVGRHYHRSPSWDRVVSRR